MLQCVDVCGSIYIMETKSTNVVLPIGLWKALRAKIGSEGTTMRSVIVRLVSEYVGVDVPVVPPIARFGGVPSAGVVAALPRDEDWKVGPCPKHGRYPKDGVWVCCS